MRVEPPNGAAIDLGDAETGLTVGITDYSARITDDFGVTTVAQRGFARTLSVKLGLPFDDVDDLQRTLSALRAIPARWVVDDGAAWLSALGYFTEFQIDLSIPPLSYCTLTVAGLAETETVADPGGDPAPDGQESTLQLVKPVAVTDDVLVSSSVPETDAPEWSGTAFYAPGAQVITTSTHRIYENQSGANTLTAPSTDPDNWLDIGPTNRWAMFDQALGTTTTGAGQVAVTLAAGSPITALALLDTDAASVRVQAPGYDRTLTPTAGGAALFTDLDVAAAAQITVTASAAGTAAWDDAEAWSDAAAWKDEPSGGTGAVAIGTLLFGSIVSLGVTAESPTAGIIDYSQKATDEFGAVTVVQRAWAKQMTAKALIDTAALDVVANRVASVRGQPCLWLGQDGVDSLTIYGFFKDFSIEVDEGVSTLSLTVEGLSTAAKVAPLSASWPALLDPDGTKPDDNAVNTRLPTAPIGSTTVGALVAGFDQVKSSLDINVPTLFDLAKTTAVLTGYTQARTTLDGEAIGTVVVQVRAVGESTVETLNLIGAKNAGGTAFVLDLQTVNTDATTTLAQRFEQTETYTDTGLDALSSSLSQTITTGDEAAAKRLDTVEATLDGADGLSAQVSFLQSAVVTTSGSAVAKAVLTVKANGRIGGLVATNDGTASTLDLDFDSTRIFKPDGTLLFETDDDGVYMPSVAVDKLKLNTAMVPAFVSATDVVQGTGAAS